MVGIYSWTLLPGVCGDSRSRLHSPVVAGPIANIVFLFLLFFFFGFVFVQWEEAETSHPSLFMSMAKPLKYNGEHLWGILALKSKHLCVKDYD